MEILFRSALIPRGGRLVARDVVVEGGVVARVTGPGSISPVGRTGGGPACHGSTGGFDNAAGRAAGIIEAEGRVLVPAFVDPHVHVREPGFDHKEDWETCSKAALKGGASCIFDMPNNKIPVNRCGLLLEKKAIAIRKSYVDFGLYVALTDDNGRALLEAPIQSEICGIKVYMAETTGKIIAGSENALLDAFRQPKPVLFHTGGGEGLSRALSVYEKASTAYPHPPPFYACHISTADELAILRRAKRRFLRVYAEVAPHYLLLEAGTYKGFPGVLPPLSSQSDVDALWGGVEDGTIDTLGTDHAPHTVEEKRMPKPPSGFPGLETAMPLMLGAFAQRNLPLKRLFELSSKNTRRIFMSDHGGPPDRAGEADWIHQGMSADLALFEEGEFIIGADGYATKCGWSPFEGWSAAYKVSVTVVGGVVAYENGAFSKPPIRCVSGKT